MKPFSRAERVGGEIQRILSELLLKSIKDPRLEMATITGVKMTRDLRLARIYFIAAPETAPGSTQNRDRVAEGFKCAMGYIKRTLASHLGLRYMPDLVFYYDESFDYGSRIDFLLKTIGPENE